MFDSILNAIPVATESNNYLLFPITDYQQGHPLERTV